MIWNNVKQKLWSVTRGERSQETDRGTSLATDAELNPAQSADDPDPASAHAQSLPSDEYQAQPLRDGHCSEKIRSWRRRVLSKRGARMYSTLVANAEQCSLAMLDAAGVVVSWHDHAESGGDHTADHVVNRHISQFYTTHDLARGIPQRDLRIAVATGKSAQQGWRRRPDGAVFWGSTIIDSMLLRDGRLQGFSYVTSRCQGEREQALAANGTPQQQTPRNAGVALTEDEAHAHGSFHYALASLWAGRLSAAVASVACDARGVLR